MGSTTASATQIPPVTSDGRSRGWKKLTGPYCLQMYPKFQQFNIVGMKCSEITHATRKQSASLICCAAPSGVVETRAVETRPSLKSRTEAPIGLVNPPQLDDGGTGLPPRDDGGRGGGGGGGGSSSGGFFLFGSLLFLSYLKDLESEKEN